MKKKARFILKPVKEIVSQFSKLLKCYIRVSKVGKRVNKWKWCGKLCRKFVFKLIYPVVANLRV